MVEPGENEETVFLIVERFGMWYMNPSIRPWKYQVGMKGQENVYTSSSKKGDCGSFIFGVNFTIRGMHVGTKGEDNGNLFVPFNDIVLGWMVASYVRLH